MFLGDTLRRVAGQIMLGSGSRRLQLLRELGADVRRVQRWVLDQKLEMHRESDFGRDHGFGSVRGVKDFRDRIPIASYDYFEPYIEQLAQGRNASLLGPREKLVMFALTSGTTGNSKKIPVTRRFIDDYRQGWTMWATQAVLDHPESIENPPHWKPKRILQLASAWNQFQTASGVPCGSISGLMASMQRRVVKSIYALPEIVQQITNPDAKYYVTLRIAIPQIVGKVVTANPSTLMRLAHLGDQWKERLIRDIAQGTLDSQIDVPPSVRNHLEHTLRHPDQKSAGNLERIVERTGHLYPKDYWPDLKLAGTWMGGTVGYYLDQLPEYFGDVKVRDIGLLASEGRMTIPLQDGSPAGILDYLNSYFEFVPVKEIQSSQPVVLESHDLKVGEEYYILLTTSSGLYRYHIHDVVRCVDHFEAVPVLEFLNKGSQFSSLTGEKLSEYQIVYAVRKAAEEFGFSLNGFVMAPVWQEPPAYVLMVEQGDVISHHQETSEEGDSWARFDDAHNTVRSEMNTVPGLSKDQVENQSHFSANNQRAFMTVPARVRQLAHRVDEILGCQNHEYREKRESGRLGALMVNLVPNGTWVEFDADQARQRGGTLEQYKHPCLINDLQFYEKFRSRLQKA